MFFLNLIRFLKGYIYFSVQGGFSERFFNLCTVENVNLWEMKSQNKVITAKVNVKDYQKIEKIAERSAMTLQKINSVGIPFLAKNNKHRLGLLIGTCFFLAFTFISTFFIWTIQIETSKNVSSEQVLQVLEELGLKRGKLSSSIDASKMAREALKSFNGELLWLAINIRGMNAYVELRDFDSFDQELTYKYPTNLVANFDGYLLSVDVRNGEQRVFEGSGIIEGEVLISGAIQNPDFSMQYVEARGEVTALHSVNMNLKCNSSDKYNTLECTKEIYTISFLGIEMPFGICKTEDYTKSYVQEKTLNLFGFNLPFSIYKKTYLTKSKEKTYLKDTISICADKFTNQSFDKFKNTLVLESKFDIKTSGKQIEILGDFECIDFMGVSKKIETFT